MTGQQQDAVGGEAISGNAGTRIGIDLGGTKTSGIVFAPDGQVLKHTRVATPRQDYDATVLAVRELVEQLRGLCKDPPTVGIGTPGSTDPSTGRLQNANSVWLNDKPLHADLERALGQPIRMANDANCLALSEMHDGAGVGVRNAFAVILGTGCGGGVVVDGKLVQGHRNICGEWGHTPLPWPSPDEVPGPACWCGRHGCLEAWISGPALVADAVRQNVDLAEITDVDALLACGETAQPALDWHVSRVARGLAMITNILDPDRIILAGGLSNLPHLTDALPAAMAPYIFANDRSVDVCVAVHGDDSGVRGAARLWS